MDQGHNSNHEWHLEGHDTGIFLEKAGCVFISKKALTFQADTDLPSWHWVFESSSLGNYAGNKMGWWGGGKGKHNKVNLLLSSWIAQSDCAIKELPFNQCGD